MTYSERAKELARTLRENAEANIRRNMTCAITDIELEEESPEEFLARQFYPDNGYESPLRFRNAFVRGYRHARDMAGKDERITAWDRIARHPFFNAAFESDGPLIDSMIELLDKALSLPSKGENMNYSSTPDADGDYLSAHGEEGRVLFDVSDKHGDFTPCYLTLKDVAALHKALGDHLEANKRELPREGAVRFSGGTTAIHINLAGDDRSWFADMGNFYTDEELIERFGTDWEELVVK